MDNRSQNDRPPDSAQSTVTQEVAKLPSLEDLARLAGELDKVDARLADLDRKQSSADGSGVAQR